MPDLFVAMFREEWRVHSELFGSVGFALFPVLVGAMACMGTVLVPVVNAALPAGDLATIVHLLFLLLGVMVGGFGLVGNEAMNRRFGQASFVAYAARTLPVSERRIFAAFVAKDTVYYLLLWILPVIAGVALASPFAGLAPATVLLLALTLLLAFLFGLAGVFLITTVWGRSKLAFAVLIGVIVAGGGAIVLATGALPPFPPLELYRSFSWTFLAATLAAIGGALAVSLLLFRPGTAGSERRHPDRFSGLADRLGRLPYPALAAKDLLDLWRSGGGVGQVLFALLLPLGLCWFLISLLERVLPPNGVLLLFAVLAGVLGSTVYTWLTAFDAFGPVRLSAGRSRDPDPIEAHLVRPAPGRAGRRCCGRRPRDGRRRSRRARRRDRARALRMGRRGHGLPRRALAERAGLRPEGPGRVPGRRGRGRHRARGARVRLPLARARGPAPPRARRTPRLRRRPPVGGCGRRVLLRGSLQATGQSEPLGSRAGIFSKKGLLENEG